MFGVRRPNIVSRARIISLSARPFTQSLVVSARGRVLKRKNKREERSVLDDFTAFTKLHPKSFVDLTKTETTRNLNLLSKEFCHSCGLELQTEDENQPGFYKLRTTAEVKPVREVDEKYATMVKNLSNDHRALLINETDFSKPKLFEPYTKQMGHEARPKEFKSIIQDPNTEKRKNCQRCHQLIHFNSFDSSSGPEVSSATLRSQIPSNASLIYVLNARDFPLGLQPEVIQNFKANKIYYVVNKIDHFFDDVKQPYRTGVKYFKNTLAKILNADPDKVFVVSAKLGWGIKEVVDNLPKGEVYIVGEVNSGKSSLIKSILYRDNLNLTKHGDYGPGISSFPSFTRAEMRFPLKTGSTIIDYPGFTDSFQELYDMMSPQDAKIINEKPVYSNPLYGLKQVRYYTKINKIGKYNGKRAVTVKGLFFLVPPDNSVVKFRVFIQGKPRVFSSVNKAVRNYREDRQEALGDIYMLKHEAYNEMERYVIPPFHGSVDLVIGGVGFVTISPTSDKTTVAPNKLFEVWVPKGVRVCVREPIMRYIYKIRSSFDIHGKPLEKSEIAKKGAPYLAEVPKDKAIVSKVFPISPDVKEPVEVFADEFYKPSGPESYREIELIDPDVQAKDTYPNFYWDDTVWKKV